MLYKYWKRRLNLKLHHKHRRNLESFHVSLYQNTIIFSCTYMCGKLTYYVPMSVLYASLPQNSLQLTNSIV